MIYEMASFKPEEKVRKKSCFQKKKKRLRMLKGVKRWLVGGQESVTRYEEPVLRRVWSQVMIRMHDG